MTEVEFQHDERTQLAILYEITLLGEVVKRLSCRAFKSEPILTAIGNFSLLQKPAIAVPNVSNP
jgi:hypothetical protein